MPGIAAVVADPNAKPSRARTPKGFTSPGEFLQEMRDRYDFGKSYNEHNQTAGQEDAKFAVGNQWDPQVEQRRNRLRKPTLTFNRLVAFMAQIIGNRLMNETEIRVWPDRSGDKALAELREGIIRSIYKNSNSDFARDEAMKYQVIGGQGFFYLSIDYTSDDVFEQEIRIKAGQDPYAATFDPLALDPTGADAEWATVEDDIPVREYQKRWPWAGETSFADAQRVNNGGYWYGQDTVRVVSYWRMVTEGTRTLALMEDGTVEDVTDKDEFEYILDVALRSDGSPYTREVPNRFAQMYICSGAEILEGPYDYPVSSIPVYRVSGWEVQDGERLHRWGLIRFLKDPQRLDNYWASMMAEQLIAAPRNKWLTTPEAVRGHEQRWRKSPSSDDPFLYFNDGEQKPEKIAPPPVDNALVLERQRLIQDLKDISNIHEASLGMNGNEVSGKALQARQMQSDVGSFIYHDRLRMADERCAKNINELIPYIYDTERMVTIVGRDNKAVMQLINSGTDNDVTAGKYGITVSVGPSSITKRQLAAEQMMGFVNAIPQIAGSVMDLVAEAQDWPKADEFARRFRMMLPAGTIPEDEMTDDEKAMAQQNSQMQQMQQQLEMAGAQAELADREAQANLRAAQANQALANAYKAHMDADSRRMDVESKNEDRDTSAVLQAVDQHNDMIEGDRQFGAAMETQREQREQNRRNFVLAANKPQPKPGGTNGEKK